MSGIRPLIEDAVAAAIAAHPKYFTERGHEKAQDAITRKIMAALVPRTGDTPIEHEAPAEPVPAGPITVDPKSPEGRAYTNLRALAGCSPPIRISDGTISIPPEAQKPAVYALADMPTPPAAFISAPAQIGSWMEFLGGSLPVGVTRKAIMVDRVGARGLLMPWPWPPSKEGKIYTAEESAE